MRIANTESPRTRPGLLILLVSLSIVVLTVWYREPATGPLHRLRSGVHAITAPVSAVGEVITKPARELFSWITDLGVSRSSLTELREQNEALRSRVAQLEEARLENERLRKLVGLTKNREIRSIAARVIGRPTNSWDGVLSIDRGGADGVLVGMPVLGPQGLLGQTVEVSGRSAKVRLITDQRSGVAAMIQRNRAVGIVHGSIDGGLTLDFIPRTTEVVLGDVVITSGLGGVYPKGIVVGEVVKIDRRGSMLFQRITVKPEGDVTQLEEVLVVVGQPRATAPEGGE